MNSMLVTAAIAGNQFVDGQRKRLEPSGTSSSIQYTKVLKLEASTDGSRVTTPSSVSSASPARGLLSSRGYIQLQAADTSTHL